MNMEGGTSMGLLPGFVFEPTDEEIILCYLNEKANGRPLPSNEVIECDLYGDHEILKKMFEEAGKQCLYFFTKLEKKANKGSRIKRGTERGTWRAQNDKPICFGEDEEYQIGSKRSFKFMPKKGFNADGRWIMHEYRLDGLLKEDQNEYVLCRVKWEREKESTCSFPKSTDSSEITLGASPDTSSNACIVPGIMREGVLPETGPYGFEDAWISECPDLFEDDWISELIVPPPESDDYISGKGWEVLPCF